MGLADEMVREAEYNGVSDWRDKWADFCRLEDGGGEVGIGDAKA